MTALPRSHCHLCFTELEHCTCDAAHSSFDYENPAFALPPGTELGDHFVVGPMIAKGGFGLIYRGMQTNLGRKVAIKEFCPGRLSTREGTNVVPLTERDESFFKYRELFFNEGPILGHINHKNVVAVYDFIKANNTGYLVMEYLSGTTTDNMVLPGALSVSIVLGLSLSILKGLKAIHNAGFLYLDCKPQNIYITQKGTIKLIDLGNTRRIGFDAASIPVAHSRGFSSPEQMQRGSALTVAADIYSFGATLYSLLTGQVPLEPHQRQDRVAAGEDDLQALAPLSAPPPGFESTVAIIKKCLALDPMDRYGDIAEIRMDMGDIIHELKLKAVTDPLAEHTTAAIKEAQNNLIVVGADVTTEPPSTTRFRAARPWMLSLFLFLSGMLFLGASRWSSGWWPQLGLAVVISSILLLTAQRLLRPYMGRPRGGRWELKGLAGEYRGSYLELDREVVLGRDPEQCNLVFTAHNISRVHAAITVDERGRVFVTDKGSRSGVHVNLTAIPPGRPAELHHKDRVHLGSQVFSLVFNERKPQPKDHSPS